MSLRIIFAGTPQFAVPPLRALIDADHTVCAVYTQPDRPAGRGRKLRASPVKGLASAAGLPVRQPPTLRDPQVQAALAAHDADLMVVVAYGLILPRPVLEAPRLGCINIHASLLPRWRGAAPIQRAILAGDRETGVTLMQMDEGLDTGAMLVRAATAIGADESAQDLHDRLAVLGARLLAETLPAIAGGAVRAEPQDDAHASYAAKLTKEEAAIDWRASAAVIDRQVRAFNPWPVAFTWLDGVPLRVWRARPVAGGADGRPGRVLAATAAGVDVATGEGVLRLLEVQPAGAKRMAAAAFANGRALDGVLFGPAGAEVP